MVDPLPREPVYRERWMREQRVLSGMRMSYSWSSSIHSRVHVPCVTPKRNWNCGRDDRANREPRQLKGQTLTSHM